MYRAIPRPQLIAISPRLTYSAPIFIASPTISRAKKSKTRGRWPHSKGFDMLLTEKYRPTSIKDFAGIANVKLDALDLVASPYDSAWLFVGNSGTGKTTLALAIAGELQAEIHHIPSQSCTVDTVKQLRDRLVYLPMFGAGWHVVIVDEADEMSSAAENAWLSLLDSTNRPAQTIIFFTCNDTAKLKDRFLSRCEVVRFSTEGLAKPAVELLAMVWENETKNSPAPNFAGIVKEAKNNIRESLQVLQRHVRRANRA
jgi:DNA polymerase III delta prime subunit